MIYCLLIYVIGMPVNYLIARAAIKQIQEGEYTQADRIPGLATSMLSFLGAAAWLMIYLCGREDGDKPAKW